MIHNPVLLYADTILYLYITISSLAIYYGVKDVNIIYFPYGKLEMSLNGRCVAGGYIH